MSTDTDEQMPSQETLLKMYEVMATITACDDRARREARQGDLKAAFYPVQGLEAACAGVGAHLSGHDYLVSTYRNLGDVVAKGVPLRRVMAEAYGRAGGVSKGKGGPMHLSEVAVGLMATSGVVGGGLPIAAGLAWANQLDGDGAVTVVTFGDGATSIGATHEAMNLAAVWQLPLVLVCQNNGWGEHTPLAQFAGGNDLTGRAAGYGMAATAVDGFDPIAVWRAAGSAVRRARAGDGPTFLECRTYRLSPHAATSDASYMPKNELDAAMERNPTPTFRRQLLDGSLVDSESLQAADDRARATVDDAFTFAQSSPPPGPEELYRDVYADETATVGS